MLHPQDYVISLSVFSLIPRPAPVRVTEKVTGLVTRLECIYNIAYQ